MHNVVEVLLAHTAHRKSGTIGYLFWTLLAVLTTNDRFSAHVGYYIRHGTGETRPCDVHHFDGWMRSGTAFGCCKDSYHFHHRLHYELALKLHEISGRAKNAARPTGGRNVPMNSALCNANLENTCPGSGSLAGSWAA